MHRALSLLKGSKKKEPLSKSEEKQKEAADEALPPYSASNSITNSKPQEHGTGKVQMKQPKSVGFGIVSKYESKTNEEDTTTDATPKKDRSCRFTVFAFGNHDTFACIPTYVNYRPDGYGLSVSPESLMWRKRDEISEIYWYCCTPYEDEILAYKDEQSGLVMWTFHKHLKRPDNAPLYSELLRWLRDNVEHTKEALQQSSVVFGPNGSYFARSPKACVWRDIPDVLQNRIDALFPGVDESQRPIPDIVAFGAAGAIVVWHALPTKGRVIIHTLPDTHTLIKTGIGRLAKDDKLEHVTLSLFNKSNGFMFTERGQITLLLSPCPRDRSVTALHKIVQWMQRKAAMEQAHLSATLIVGEKNKFIVISPKSSWTGVEFEK